MLPDLGEVLPGSIDAVERPYLHFIDRSLAVISGIARGEHWTKLK